MADVETLRETGRGMQEEEMKSKKKKNYLWLWSDEMVKQLIDFLQAYKIEMEYKGLDFDADKCTQYTRHS